MIEVPKAGRIWLYGPTTVNVISSPIEGRDVENLVALRDYMLNILNMANAIGLAAPQIGVFKRLAIIRMASHFIVDLVNPYIFQMYDREIEGYEECLSIPPRNNKCLVPRMQTIEVEYSSVEEPFRRRSICLHGRDAVVAQHEIDHLNGTFFVDRATAAEKRNVLDRFHAYQRERKLNVPSNSRKQSTHREQPHLSGLL